MNRPGQYRNGKRGGVKVARKAHGCRTGVGCGVACHGEAFVTLRVAS